MRVIVISKWFPTPYQPSSGVFVLEQIKALRRLGVDVALVIAPTPWAPAWLRFWPRVRKYKDIPAQSQADGFRVEHPRVLNLPGDRLLFLYGFFFYLRCRRTLRKLLKEQKADLIHAHTILPEGFAAALLGREFQLPVVCTLHGGDINDLLPPINTRGKKLLAIPATKWAFSKLKHFIAVSYALTGKVAELTGKQNMEMRIAHNGADMEVFKPRDKAETRRALALPQQKFIFVFIGNLVSDKGVPFLLAAFAQVCRPDTALYLVGSGNKEQELRAQARSLGIENSCVFAGRRPHAEVALWLSAGDCFVLSSITEGSPTILSEAMLCRTPVVATAVGGVPELIRDGDTGLMVPSRDSRALAQAMEFMLTNRDEVEHMAARAEVYARENLTWEANARKTLAVYHAAVNEISASETGVMRAPKCVQSEDALSSSRDGSDANQSRASRTLKKISA